MKISSSRHIPSHNPTARARNFARRGFTLIELMVVLAIVAVVSAITLGAFNSLSDTNQRTGCQANMAQLYQGLRQYMADNNGQPPFYDPSRPAFNAADPASGRGIGLWALWTFPDKDNFDKLAKVGERPNATYLRSPKVLHCPSDSEALNAANVLHSDLYANADKSEYNMDYLSYQGQDVLTPPAYVFPATPPAFDPDKALYLPSRTTTVADANFKRQLVQKTAAGAEPISRPPTDDTVVTWCQYHRLTRDYDNVLFFDGSVQLLPRVQDNLDGSCNPQTTPATLENWKRVPRRTDCDQ